MFSGIIEELGQVRNINQRGKNALIEIAADKVLEDTKIGDSISVNGACLTIVDKKTGSIEFEAMPQTLRVTNLGQLRIGEKVNLERALKVGDRISGHFVNGHVDCIGIIRKRAHINNNLCFEITVPAEFIKYCILKGSIAVDGISLTIVSVKSNCFSVYIIPHTFKNTTFGFKGPSGKVNVEFDILAKIRK